MKIQKEIEKLAEQDFNDRQECGHYELADLKSRDYYYDGFTNGYTQCQEDNADKKYTDEDVIDLFRKFGIENRNIPEDAYSWIELKSEHIEEWIYNKLNKQD
jgi:hypothetical protein